MKAVIQYTPDDIRRLVAADAKALGYSVSPDDVDMPGDVLITVAFEGVPAVPASRAQVGAAQAIVSPTHVAPPLVSASPPSGAPKPNQEGAWTSQSAGGGDPRFVPIEPPDSRYRVPLVREIGHDSGLVAPGTRGTPYFIQGRTAGSLAEDAPAEAPEVDVQGPLQFGMAGADFLDDYLSPQKRR